MRCKLWRSHWTTDTAILLEGLETQIWTLSARVHFAVFIFLSPHDQKLTGQVGGVKVFAAPGELFLPR